MRFLLLLASLLSLPSFAQPFTEHSRLVRYVQVTYADQTQAHPILIFDRDEIEWRFARAGAYGKEISARITVIQQYVREKKGIEISAREAGNLETFLVAGKEGANALPIHVEGISGPIKLCAVFPASPSSNRRLEAERVLDLRVPGLYRNEFRDIRDPLSYRQLAMLSILHELAHCLDTKFMPKLYSGVAEPSADEVHQSESFAETLAVLLLAKEGDSSIGKRRAEYRAVYARVVGNFMANNPSQGAFNPNYTYGGPIYYLVPSIEAAQRWIDRHPGHARMADLTTLMKTSEEIVHAQSFSFQALNLVRASFAEGLEVAVARSRQFEQDFPSVFVKTTEALLSFYAYTNQVLSYFFSGSESQSAGKLSKLDISALCPSFLSGDAKATFSAIQTYRNDLMREHGSPERQRERGEALSNVFETLQNSCSSTRTARAEKAAL